MTLATHNPIKLRIYAIGGFGLNVGSQFDRKRLDDGLDHTDVVYVDTSGANHRDDIPDDKIYRFPKLDGGGKDRREIHGKVAPHVPEILKKFPAQDFNIVLHSSSGASGSTVGPELVREIMQRGGNAIVVQAGSTTGKKEVENTIGAIRSYANFSSRLARPIVSYYRESNAKSPPSEVDFEAVSALFLISVVFSSKNVRVDRADLTNLLNYQKVTSFKPELSSIDFFRDVVSFPADHVLPQAMAMLVAPDNTDSLGRRHDNLLIEYVCDGVLNEEFVKKVDGKAIAAVVFTGDFVQLVGRLEEELQVYKTQEQSRNTKLMSLTLTSGDTDDGMVF